MRRFILFFAIVMPFVAVSGEKIDFHPEYLRYRVTYKWGLIQKNAGKAQLRLVRDGDGHMTATLTASSDPWADRIYYLRDTLTTKMRCDDMYPVIYEKYAHENGYYGHDKILFAYNGNSVNATCEHFHINKKGKQSCSTKEMEAALPGLDFLSAYYYLRGLPYESMNVGEQRTATVLSGTTKEYLALTYQGIDEIELDDKKYNCYRVEFTFTSDGAKKSSDGITAWIRTTGTRIPIRVTGSLPIGKVHLLWLGE